MTDGAGGGPAIIACGSRNWTDADLIAETLDAIAPRLIIVGGARGADELVERWCWRSGGSQPDTRCIVIPAQWHTHGRAAGPVRNGVMLRRLLAERDDDELVVAFRCRGESRGSDDMLRQAAAAGVQCWTVLPGSSAGRSYEGKR